MLNGSDYLIRLKTREIDAVIPFLSKTLREKIFLCEEYAPIEGEGRPPQGGWERPESGLSGGSEQ